MLVRSIARHGLANKDSEAHRQRHRDFLEYLGLGMLARFIRSGPVVYGPSCGLTRCSRRLLNSFVLNVFILKKPFPRVVLGRQSARTTDS